MWLKIGSAFTGALLLAAAALLIVWIGLARAIPYEPFIVESYVVSPSAVCTSAPVKATITRRFTREVTHFEISETWVTAGSAVKYENNKPVQSNQGELPPSLLKPHNTFKAAVSPLLKTAPDIPGQYRVRISTAAKGRRYGVTVSGNATFLSDNIVTVRSCPGKGRP